MKPNADVLEHPQWSAAPLHLLRPTHPSHCGVCHSLVSVSWLPPQLALGARLQGSWHVGWRCCTRFEIGCGRAGCLVDCGPLRSVAAQGKSEMISQLTCSLRRAPLSGFTTGDPAWDRQSPTALRTDCMYHRVRPCNELKFLACSRTRVSAIGILCGDGADGGAPCSQGLRAR